jgi:diaminopimelate decarboxylase
MAHNILITSLIPKEKSFYSVVGYICETDTFANRRISEIKEGDILSFRNAGAYCYSMASNYNSDTDQPKFMDEWKGTFNRAHETFEDLLKIKLPLPAELQQFKIQIRLNHI